MSASDAQCPEGLNEAIGYRDGSAVHVCKITSSNFGSCDSTIFPVNGVEYSQVCGSVLSYLGWGPKGFGPYHENPTRTIDDVYVDGISITHGQSPRKHIWTFAGADITSSLISCPCAQNAADFAGTVPPFVGQDYFCETIDTRQWLIETLWDGQGCGGNSACCSFNNPPWFCKELPQPTTDDIELRLCSESGWTYPYSFKIFVK